MAGVGLVPAPAAGTQEYFLRSNGWADGDSNNYFLASDGQWRKGDSEHLFLRGDGSWANMQLGFTLENLALNDLVKFGKFFGVDIVWRIAAKNHQGMPENSVTLVSDKIVCLKCVDAKEPNNFYGSRNKYGNNDYTVSNIRQWLNSSASAGNWYSAQHSFDEPPSSSNVWNGYNPYQDKAGFLNEFTSQEIAAILSATRVIGGKEGNGTSCVDKVWLPTSNEYGAETISNNGTQFPIFSDDNSRIAYPTSQAVSDSTYKSSQVSPDKTLTYWTATSDSVYHYQMHSIYTTGGITGGSALTGHLGIRPALNLSAKVFISPEKDSSGCYTVIL